MVMARGAGCWARASGASTRTVERTERRKENFIRDDPLGGYESKKQTASVTHALLIDGAGAEGRAAARSSRGSRAGSAKARLARSKIFCAGCIFSLHAVTTLVFFECELASFSTVTAGHSTQRRERVSLRRTRVKIEFYIASRPATFPRNPDSKEKSRQTYALAACSRHLLHGVWRHVRDGRDHSRRGLRPWDSGFAVPAGAMVPANGVYDRRALQRAAARRWLLRVGATRLGGFLGLPGSVALAGRKHL